MPLDREIRHSTYRALVLKHFPAGIVMWASSQRTQAKLEIAAPRPLHRVTWPTSRPQALIRAPPRRLVGLPLNRLSWGPAPFRERGVALRRSLKEERDPKKKPRGPWGEGRFWSNGRPPGVRRKGS